MIQQQNALTLENFYLILENIIFKVLAEVKRWQSFGNKIVKRKIKIVIFKLTFEKSESRDENEGIERG